MKLNAAILKEILDHYFNIGPDCNVFRITSETQQQFDEFTTQDISEYIIRHLHAKRAGK